MKQVTFYIESNEIHFSNDWMGDETITVNGQQVSKKFSFFGTKHNFTIENNGVIEEYSIVSDISFKNNVVISLYKDTIKKEEKSINYFEDYNLNFNSTFVIGLIFILYALIDGDSKLLGVLGLIFIIISFKNDSKNTKEETGIVKKD